MDWTLVVQNVLTFTAASGIIGLIVRSLINRYMERDIENYKHGLDKDIEKFKSTLQLERIRFSNLHDKQGEIIAELYAKLVQFEKDMASFTSPMQGAGEPSMEEKAKTSAISANDFSDYFNKHRIYFNKSICDKIDSIYEVFKKSFKEFTIPPVWDIHNYREAFSDGRPSRVGKWQEVWTVVKKEIPSLREELEIEFRDLLGVT